MFVPQQFGYFRNSFIEVDRKMAPNSCYLIQTVEVNVKLYLYDNGIDKSS